MCDVNVSQNSQTFIRVERVGFYYYLNEHQWGFVIAMNQIIHRDIAIEKVTAANGGTIPEECNFDVCLKHRWTWGKENHMQAVPS